MKRLIQLLAFTTILAVPHIASAQWMVKDLANLATQIQQVAQFRTMIKEQARQSDLAQKARDAHHRAKAVSRQTMQSWHREVDRIKSRYADEIHYVTTDIENYTDYADESGKARLFSYHMSGAQLNTMLPMDSTVESPVAHRKYVNQMQMTNVTTLMSQMRLHEKKIAFTSQMISRLKAKMSGASDSMRQVYSAELDLLEARRENEHGLLDIARTNLEGVVEMDRIHQQQQAVLEHEESVQFLNQLVNN
ncbi:MAG: hypothetical protein OXE59_07645 [Bacteroidetes bacterium]|nr:hypothetical protein [Bacteroidota bacterium]